MIGYARVSTEDQNLDMQIAALLRAGVAKENIYTEHVSGAAKRRPRFEAALSACRPGDVFVVWRLDRLSRTMKDMLERFEWFGDNNVGLWSLTEKVDTTSAFGVFYIHLAAALAQLERQLIAFRTKEGMARKREREPGYKPGPAPKFTAEMQAKAEMMIRRGRRIREIAEIYGVSPQTVHSKFDAETITRFRAEGPYPAAQSKKPKPAKKRKAK